MPPLARHRWSVVAAHEGEQVVVDKVADGGCRAVAIRRGWGDGREARRDAGAGGGVGRTERAVVIGPGGEDDGRRAVPLRCVEEGGAEEGRQDRRCLDDARPEQLIVLAQTDGREAVLTRGGGATRPVEAGIGRRDALGVGAQRGSLGRLCALGGDEFCGRGPILLDLAAQATGCQLRVVRGLFAQEVENGDLARDSLGRARLPQATSNQRGDAPLDQGIGIRSGEIAGDLFGMPIHPALRSNNNNTALLRGGRARGARSAYTVLLLRLLEDGC